MFIIDYIFDRLGYVPKPVPAPWPFPSEKPVKKVGIDKAEAIKSMTKNSDKYGYTADQLERKVNNAIAEMKWKKSQEKFLRKKAG